MLFSTDRGRSARGSCSPDWRCTSLGALILFLPAGQAALNALPCRGAVFSPTATAATAFLGGPRRAEDVRAVWRVRFILALRVLPQILYVSALIGVLYHLGRDAGPGEGLGAVLLLRSLGNSPIESFAAVITIAIARANRVALPARSSRC